MMLEASALTVGLVEGVAEATVIAGSLWSVFSPAMTFYAGAAFSTAALAGLLIDSRKNRIF